MSVDTIAIIGAITTLLAGMWGMFRYIIKTFLTHLEQKNGHNERIVKEFSETIRGFQNAISTLNKTQERTNELQDKANENYLNIQGVLSECGKALLINNKKII